MLAVRLVRTMYVLTGVATTAYQLVWTRELAHALGQTEAALATWTVTLLGSVAIGSAAGGALVDRCQPAMALKLFALAQVLAGIFAVLLVPSIEALVPWAASAYADGQAGVWFGFVRAVIGLGVLVVPCALLGSTFPLAIRWLDGREHYPASGASWLYALHALGGALGVGLGGLALEPAIGLSGLSLLAAAVNWLAAAGAMALGYVLSTSSATPPGDSPSSSKRTLLGTTPAKSRIWVARVAIVGSAFVLFAYQSIWTRILLLIVGPSALVATTLPVVFAAGVGVGASAGARLLRLLTLGQVTVALGISVALGGLCSLIAAWSVPQLPLLLAGAADLPASSPWTLFGNQPFVMALVMLPMTVALGSALPLAVAIALPNRTDAANRVAGLWGLHLVGGMGGMLIASFVLIELFGLRWSLMSVALLAFVIGVWVVFLAGETTFAARVFWAVVVGGATFSAFVLPEWEPRVLASGAYELAEVPRPDVRTGLEASESLYYEEGVGGTASVRRVAGITSLAFNGHLRASNGIHLVPQKLLAHLALLLHPMPRDVCILGLSTGITLGSALRHPLGQVDVLEPSPEVLQGASYFATENHGALSDPRVALQVGDPLAHVRLTARQYDVIVSDPPSMWVEGAAASFSTEFYLASRGRLKPGGIFAQWVATTALDPNDFRTILATFAQAFPEASAWVVPSAGVILAGSIEPMAPLVQTVEDQWDRPGVSADLAAIGATQSGVVLALWAGGAPALLRTAGDAPPLTLNRLPVSAGRKRGSALLDDALASLTAASAEDMPPAPVVRARGNAAPDRQFQTARLLQRAGAATRALQAFALAAAAQPSNPEVLSAWASAASAAGRASDAMTFLATNVERDPSNVAAAIELSRLQAASGRIEQATATARRAAEQSPKDAGPLIQLGMIAAAQDQRQALAPLVDGLIAAGAADRPEVAFLSAHLSWWASDLPKTIALLGRTVSEEPDNARAWAFLGRAQARAGARNRARDAFQSAIGADPRVASNYVDLGRVELDDANAAGAVVWFSQALAIDPESAAAVEGLAQALRRLGQTRRAADIEARLTPPRR